jgi:hypothetical protein
VPPSVSRLSRQCGILNISQSYRLPQPVMGIAGWVGPRAGIEHVENVEGTAN